MKFIHEKTIGGPTVTQKKLDLFKFLKNSLTSLENKSFRSALKIFEMGLTSKFKRGLLKVSTLLHPIRYTNCLMLH